MRRLFKADSEYNRVSNTVFFIILLIAALANSIFGDLEEFLAPLIWISLICNGAIIATESVKTKRIRFLAGLPLPVRTLGAYRIYGIMIVCVQLMALLFLSSLIGQRGHLRLDYTWWILTKAGSLFIMIGCMGLTTNLFYYIKETRLNRSLIQWIVGPFFMVLAIIGAVLYFFSIPGPGEFSREFEIALSEILLTFNGSFGVLLFGLLILGLDYYVYERRRSFTDETGWPSY